MIERAVLWRRLDQPGHEAARLRQTDGGWELAGSAVFAHRDEPCRLDYTVACDGLWRTIGARVSGWIGRARVEVDVASLDGGRWTLNGRDCAQVADCIDVDLNFSPSTNLLPIRRLRLEVGQAARVRAAWLRFPGFALEPLDQTYRRAGEATYLYESGDGGFSAEIRVDDLGLVANYAGIWTAEASTASAAVDG